MGQIIWINGLAGAGKTTTAKALCAKLEELHAKGGLKSKGVIYTDGDDFREVFEHSFGYSKEARINLTRKKIALCVALAKQGFCVVHTAISLFNECYKHNRELCEKNHLKYIEIYIKCPTGVLEKRDQKGLYSKAKAGLQKDVVGMDIAFDEPKADLVLGGTNSTETNVANILEFLTTFKN